eukprot:Hpha_TRINITY_DN16493_c4_g1::TRINITY_DN16493_c4_g1_i1::g.159817::m.159817
MRLQVRRVEASVDVAAVVAAALARYDVDEAEQAIDKDEHLPHELAESYRRLVSNLRGYRAYLPHSCLVHEVTPPEMTPPEGAEDKSKFRIHAGEETGLSREALQTPVSPEVPCTLMSNEEADETTSVVPSSVVP